MPTTITWFGHNAWSIETGSGTILLDPFLTDSPTAPVKAADVKGPDDSIDAIKLLNPKRVAPCHYNTWPPIAQDARAWAERVRSHTAADPIVLEPGDWIAL